MKQVEDETSVDLFDARKADEDVNSVYRADESADAEKSMFELQAVQSTAALSYAKQVETPNEQLPF